MKKVILIVLIMTMLAGCRFKFGINGKHTGFITAIQQNGIIWKNYRVFIKTSLDSSQEDVYCINRNEKALVDALRQAQEGRIRVTIEYNSYNNIFDPSQCEGDEIENFYSVE